jgi:hypothetical protein
MLAVGQAGSDISHINEREFKIPITLPNDQAARAEIEQLQLYVSKDEGRTWQKEAVARPNQQNFEFFAPKDGTYWFNVGFTDRQKKNYPADIHNVPPALKVVIDTRKPLIKFTLTERQGDQVTVAWDVREEHPDLGSMRLEYRQADSGLWVGVAGVSPAASGSRKFSVGSASVPVAVRITVADLAGNSGSTQHEFPGEASPVATNAGPAPGTNPLTGAPGPNATPATSANASGSPLTGNAGVPGSPAGTDVNPNWANRPATGPKPVESFRPSETPRGIPATSLASVDERSNRVAIASSSMPPPPSKSAYPLPGGSLPPPAQATPAPATAPKRNIQYTNHEKVELSYEVSKVGPSGVGQVTLYCTTDNGATWRVFEEDADLAPPFNLELPSEGLFGFTLVVKSKAGLGRSTPQPGQTPDIHVELDATPPEAVLYKVEADPRKKDTLFLSWDATDKNLTGTPIRLFWSAKADGPWEPIANELPNTGRFPWTMPENLPYKVYLRLQVRDLAGNVANADTHEPVLVDLTEPEGRITGIISGGAKKPE